MCRSMADIRSTAAEIRRGKKRRWKKEKGKKLQGKNIMAPLLHRAAITKPKHMSTINTSFTTTTRHSRLNVLRSRCNDAAMNLGQPVPLVYILQTRNSQSKCHRFSEQPSCHSTSNVKPTKETLSEYNKSCDFEAASIVNLVITLMRLSSRSMAETGDATVATSGVVDCVIGANR